MTAVSVNARTEPSPRPAGFPLEYQPRNGSAGPERYRSGHNGADSKSDGRVKPARGFESHPLRHPQQAPPRRLRFLRRLAVSRGERLNEGVRQMIGRHLDEIAIKGRVQIP